MKNDWPYGRNASPKTLRTLPYGIKIEVENYNTIGIVAPAGWSSNLGASNGYALYRDFHPFHYNNVSFFLYVHPVRLERL